MTSSSRRADGWWASGDAKILVELDADFLHHLAVLVVVAPDERGELRAGEEEGLEAARVVELRFRVGRFQRALQLIAQAIDHRLRRAGGCKDREPDGIVKTGVELADGRQVRVL